MCPGLYGSCILATISLYVGKIIGGRRFGRLKALSRFDKLKAPSVSRGGVEGQKCAKISLVTTRTPSRP